MSAEPSGQARVTVRHPGDGTTCHVLTRRRNPVEFLALIDSEVLVRPVGPPEVMADQLDHLLRMAELPHVTIQLVPSTAPGYHPTPEPARWRKSSLSSAQDTCVELAHTKASLRDSKNPSGPTLAIELTPLLTAVKAGRFDR